MNRESTRNTLRYLFTHMRSGIYVMIRHGKVRMFAPFVNREYKNTWGHALKWYGADGKTPGQDVVEYYQEKVRTKGARQENVIDDVQEWWANGHIICNEHCPPGEAHSQFWGDQLLVPLRDMLHALCEAKRAFPPPHPCVGVDFDPEEPPRIWGVPPTAAAAARIRAARLSDTPSLATRLYALPAPLVWNVLTFWASARDPDY